MDKKKIPCRVCGKLFTPCVFCQSHQGTFRWRNFACSIDCAKEYIQKATEYRQANREKIEKSSDTPKNNIEETKENERLQQTSKKSKRGQRKKLGVIDEAMQIKKTEIVNDEG